jgi:hypothetical protein
MLHQNLTQPLGVDAATRERFIQAAAAEHRLQA